MKDFLLVYQGGDPDWAENTTPEQMQGVMEQWGSWFKQLEASGNLRNPGAALDSGGAVVTKNGGDFKTDQSLPEVKELIGGFSVIAAKSLSEATEVAKGTPFLEHNPDGKVLVRPVMQH